MQDIPVTTPSEAEEQKQWQAESDARTLAEAEVIKNDKTRLPMALKAAQTMEKEVAEQLRGFKKVARLEYKTMKSKGLGEEEAEPEGEGQGE